MRIKKLLNYLSENQVFYITDSADMYYYAHFSGEGALLITKDQKFILTDGRYKEQAEHEKGFETVISLNHSEFLKNLNKEIIIQPESISYKKVDFFLKAGLTVKTKEINFDFLRSVKDEDEIKCLKKSAEIAEISLKELLPLIKENVTERELSSKLDYLLKKNGAQKESFQTILISGKNTSLPHGVPTDKKLQKGDFITIDFGCIYQGYCSDMTRTFALGFATDEMKNVYNIVKNAQQQAENTVLSGKTLKEIDAVARNIIEENGFGEYFVHSTGHGVGIKIHEYPNLSLKAEGILQENNIVTVEPGIYIPNKFGVRIENTVLVKKDKGVPLQKFKKELIIL